MERRAQVWSMDVIIAIIIFLFSIGVFLFFTLEQESGQEQTRLTVQSRLIADYLTESVLQNGAVDEGKLQNFVADSVSNYDQVRGNLGVRDDFCVVFIDENGDLILVTDGTNMRAGIGNDDLNLSLVDTSENYNCGDIY